MARQHGGTDAICALAQNALDRNAGELGKTLLAGLAEGGGPWRNACSDVLVRRMLLRFVLIRAALLTHVASGGRPECQPSCSPSLPEALDPGSALCQRAVLAVAAVFRKESMFSQPQKES